MSLCENDNVKKGTIKVEKWRKKKERIDRWVTDEKAIVMRGVILTMSLIKKKKARSVFWYAEDSVDMITK